MSKLTRARNARRLLRATLFALPRPGDRCHLRDVVNLLTVHAISCLSFAFAHPGKRSANTKPSRSTTSPVVIATGC